MNCWHFRNESLIMNRLRYLTSVSTFNAAHSHALWPPASCLTSPPSSMVIRDLTLRSAASFGSFHLIRLLYDEYMFYLVEHRVARATGETAIGVMGEVGVPLLPPAPPACQRVPLCGAFWSLVNETVLRTRFPRRSSLNVIVVLRTLFLFHFVSGSSWCVGRVWDLLCWAFFAGALLPYRFLSAKGFPGKIRLNRKRLWNVL